MMLLVGSASVLLYRSLPSELAPMEDQGTVMVFANAPEGATLDYLNSYTKKIDEIFRAMPELQRSMMIMGRPTVSNMLSYTSMKPWDERERTLAAGRGQHDAATDGDSRHPRIRGDAAVARRIQRRRARDPVRHPDVRVVRTARPIRRARSCRRSPTTPRW